jgi:hypothetical protein
MAKDVQSLIREAATLLSEALDDAAGIALVAVEKYGAQLQGFCKQVATEAGMPDAWNALRRRAQRLQESRSQGATERPARESEARTIRAAKQVLRDPKMASAVMSDPAVQESVAQTVASSPILARRMVEHKTARTTVNKALDDVYEREATERKARAAEAPMAKTMTKLDRERIYLRRVQMLSRIRADLRDAVDLFKGPIPDDDRAEFVQKVEQLADLIAWLRDHIASGKELDEELVALLEGGE